MSDMRDDLNAALESVDDNYEETTQEIETEEVAVESSEDTSSEDTSAEDTGFEADEGVAADIAAAAEPAPEPTAETAEGDAEPVVASNDSIKAPVGWGPKEREDWSKIPRHLQEKVMGREKELNTMMQTTADARKTHADFTELSTQYGGVLSGVLGNNPMETTRALFDTVANLRMGSPIQKAQIVADLITDFGVDINTLDSAIVGQAPPAEAQHNDQFKQQLDARMAPFEAMLGQQEAYKNQQAQQRQETANNEVAEFGGKAEFLNDVRHDMADLIEMSEARGQTMTLPQAYAKACAINPQISSIIEERQKHAQLTTTNNSMAAKRNAASSVNGRQSGGGGGTSAMSMRDQISSAWDNQNNI